MAQKFYIDTSIWIDLYEDRKGYLDEPLGEYALKLFALIKAKNSLLAISNMLIRELEGYYSIEEINEMIKPFEKMMLKIISTEEQRAEAKKIAKERNLPPGDVLHAIIARDNNLVLVSSTLTI
ncbi:MAG: PIN domain-containing protein [Nanoarchaeota archaeon]